MADYSKYQHILVEKDDGLATVTLNRPESLNAINPRLHSELVTIWSDLSEDHEIDAILFTGAGRAFSVGGDIKGMAKVTEDKAAKEKSSNRNVLSMFTFREARMIINNLLDCEQPIIAAINGDAMGLAANMALFCDITVASETARIADPHVRVGIVAGDGGAVIWPYLIGPNRAKEFLMRGSIINGADAAKIGLVNYAVPAAEVMAKARALARELADGPRLAIRWTKHSVNKMLRDSVNLILDTSLALESVSFSSPDHREAARAFVEKRKPDFKRR